jgi:hypothetical protein
LGGLRRQRSDTPTAGWARGGGGGGGPQTYKIPELVAGSFGLCSVLLTDGSIMDPC